MSRSLPRIVCVLLALGVADACYTHEPTGPMRAVSEGASSANALSRDQTPAGELHTVIALSRATSLDKDVTASAIIGPESGTIEIGAAGVKIIIPPGALSTERRIRMTAKSGHNVAYTFHPHGIVFNLPVTIEQNLDYTAAGATDAGTLQAGYFWRRLNDIYVDQGKSLAQVSEVRHAIVDSSTDPRIVRFFIYHFSGYILSTGFAPTDSGGGDSGSP